jgi:hypothetical protein
LEKTMRKLTLPLLALCAGLAAPMASAKEGDAFYCYWVDPTRHEFVSTDIFPGDRQQAAEIADVFAMDMTMRSGKGKARKYDCAWREGPREAADALDNLRATHLGNGFHIDVVDWSPMTR